MTVHVDIPGSWSFSHAEIYPAPLEVNVSEALHGTGDRKSLRAVIQVPGSPTAGLQQGALTLHCLAGEQRQVVTVPLSVVWNRTAPDHSTGE
jgi:hypothetical protein